ncbi:cell shape-determining protein MreC [Aliidongia dinghuensis]|uniref:Cell shape-determining protein MreC n=1 Tax=Aliidongia dinghuensis TaxID=1867774 RepID=A0A8J2YQK4_9PROT|nr:rod shape-determining protein MreC [Aliidongia dinghuensis]GGF01257.1 cell shape-determining protein MreC [Aliidongia dinghuensis]
MKSRSAPVSQIVGPLKSAAQRFAYSALVLLSVAIMIVGRADQALIERIRTQVNDVMAPVLEAMTQPVTAVSDTVAHFHALAELYRENERLRAENAALLQWQQVAHRLDNENAGLRSLLNYQPDGSTWFITARVIGTSGGAFSRNLLVNRGTLDSVAKGQAAAGGTGLIGRVTEVGERAARVLMITDLNSRIPVVVGGSDEHAILAGDNTDRPQLAYLGAHAKINVGDRVVTSGDGGVFPPGMPIGTVAAVEGGNIRVEPFADLSRVEYLRIVDFGLSGVLPPDAVPQPKAPKRPKGDAGKGEAGPTP